MLGNCSWFWAWVYRIWWWISDLWNLQIWSGTLLWFVSECLSILSTRICRDLFSLIVGKWKFAPMFILQAAHASCMFRSTCDWPSFCRLVLPFMQWRNRRVSPPKTCIFTTKSWEVCLLYRYRRNLSWSTTHFVFSLLI